MLIASKHGNIHFPDKTNPYGTSNAFMPVEIYKPFNVFCNFEGWIVVARRVVGTVFSFDRDWAEYKDGFGSLEGEFWLGLEKVHHLTTQGKSFTLQVGMSNITTSNSDKRQTASPKCHF